MNVFPLKVNGECCVIHRHRTRCLASILTGSMLIECVPLLVLPSYPWAQLACVFISCFFQSWLYGKPLTCSLSYALGAIHF